MRVDRELVFSSLEHAPSAIPKAVKHCSDHIVFRGERLMSAMHFCSLLLGLSSPKAVVKSVAVFAHLISAGRF